MKVIKKRNYIPEEYQKWTKEVSCTKEKIKYGYNKSRTSRDVLYHTFNKGKNPCYSTFKIQIYELYKMTVYDGNAIYGYVCPFCKRFCNIGETLPPMNIKEIAFDNSDFYIFLTEEEKKISKKLLG